MFCIVCICMYASYNCYVCDIPVAIPHADQKKCDPIALYRCNNNNSWSWFNYIITISSYVKPSLFSTLIFFAVVRLLAGGLLLVRHCALGLAGVAPAVQGQEHLPCASSPSMWREWEWGGNIIRIWYRHMYLIVYKGCIGIVIIVIFIQKHVFACIWMIYCYSGYYRTIQLWLC